MTFDEEKLRFDFLESKWASVLPFDKTAFIKKAKDAIEPTKAVDFLGIFQANTLIFIEVKDFRGHRIETKPRVEGREDPLWLEVSKKVRDSIPVIVGAARNSSTDANAWKTYSRFLHDEKRKSILCCGWNKIFLQNTFKAKIEKWTSCTT
ncbi:MAG: hypothetical protein IPM82_09265 [Saprospiraceae bacterium]|nr:hypothetical protein [Saprospiraceae bacterium]